MKDMAGLTFKEAKAVMASPNAKDLVEDWGTTQENVYNLSRRGFEKINESGHDIREMISEEMLLRILPVISND